MIGVPLAQFSGYGAPVQSGQSLLKRVRVRWSSADIDAMATPKTLVPAPGAGRIVVPVIGISTKPAYAAAPAANPAWQMYYANDVGVTNLFSDTPLANINVTNEAFSQTNRFAVTAHGPGAVPTAINQAIVLRGNVNAPGGSGTKSITFILYYVVLQAGS